MASHLELGKAGEKMAQEYLKKIGYRILACNVKLKRDEIDVIAYDPAEKMMVFVEVKTRTASSDAYPIRSAVTAHKRHCLLRAIRRWSIQKEYDGPGRLDVICVEKNQIKEHLRDIGSPML